MRKFLQIFTVVTALSFAMTSCNINDDYDLSNVDGDLGLGDEETVFDMPLATVTINVDKSVYSGDGASYNRSSDDTEDSETKSVLDLLDAFLPSEEYFPGGVDLTMIDSNNENYDEEYLDSVADALVLELSEDSDKCALFSEELLTNENLSDEETYDILLSIGYEESDATDLVNGEADAETIAAVATKLETAAADDTEGVLKSQIVATVESNTDAFDSTSTTQTDSFSIDAVDIDQEVIDILASGKSLKIRLYYSLATNVTDNYDLEIKLKSGDLSVTLGEKSDVESGNINDSTQLESLLNSLELEYTLDIKSYSGSSSKNTDGRYFVIKLMATKTGTLTF